MNRNDYVYLREICTVNQGLQIPISKRFKESGENRYFYITVQFLKDGHKEKYYVENPPSSSICNEDDIIVVRTGSTGRILTGVKGCAFIIISLKLTMIKIRLLASTYIIA